MTEINNVVNRSELEVKTDDDLRRMGLHGFKARPMVVILLLLLGNRRGADKVRRWLTELKEQTEQSDEGKNLP